MRIMMKVGIPHEPFNTLVKAGSAGAKMSKVLAAMKPEAVYFTEFDGTRGAILIVDMADPSKVPALAEPWFLTFNATVEFRIIMSPDDLKKAGLDEIGQKWAKG